MNKTVGPTFDNLSDMRNSCKKVESQTGTPCGKVTNYPDWVYTQQGDKDHVEVVHEDRENEIFEADANEDNWEKI